MTERKDGKWVHYHLVDTGPLADLVDRTLRLAAGDDRLRQDARVVEELRRVPLEILCRTGFDLQASGVLPAPAQARPRRNRTATRRNP